MAFSPGLFIFYKDSWPSHNCSDNCYPFVEGTWFLDNKHTQYIFKTGASNKWIIYFCARTGWKSRRCLFSGLMPLLQVTHTFPMKSESSMHVCLIQKSMAEEQRVYCVPVGVVCLRNWVEENQWPPFCLPGKVRTTLIYEVFNLWTVCSGRFDRCVPHILWFRDCVLWFQTYR